MWPQGLKDGLMPGCVSYSSRLVLTVLTGSHALRASLELEIGHLDYPYVNTDYWWH